MEVTKDSRVIFLQQKSYFPENLPDTESSANEFPEFENSPPPAVVFLPVDKITKSPFQTRQFDESTDLSELVQSIQCHGVLQPVLVRRLQAQSSEMGTSANDRYELVAGERRLRAAKVSGLTLVPALVSDLSDRQAVEISIIENAQREDLNPIEEARAISILFRQFHLTQNEIAESIGRSRASVSNALRLLQLDPEVQDLIISGQLSGGHGKALLGMENTLLQRRLARRAARASLSVRVVENLIQRLKERAQAKPSRKKAGSAEQREAIRLQNILGIERVAVRAVGTGSRSVTLRFEDEKTWKQFLSRLKRR